MKLFADSPRLDAAAGVPAHVQIERWFTEAIGRGDLMAGDRIPREQDLAAAFGVSRMTLRQALAALAARGVVDRQPGRAGGTFIVEPKIACDLTGLAGFTDRCGGPTCGPGRRCCWPGRCRRRARSGRADGGP